ncbi:hypothetical protein [Acidaminobacter sp. JC074]|uniref:hypothetical protein n=1 Tax=Acidaminobacter sp. JC074 TaxID=2530199 RepID=UPI001F11370F|nr:hypothetical protein [Acidaminobacter sp. JC074]
MNRLFERTSIGGMKLKNRIFASSIGTNGNSMGGIHLPILITSLKEPKVAQV